MQKRAADQHPFRGYDIVAILIVVLTLLANTVSFKMVEFGPFILRLGIFVAAGSHVLADILVEVYGYARARRVIWLTTASVALMFLIFKCAVWLPGAADWTKDEEFNMIFNRNTITILTTLFVVFFGHITNALIMAKMKILMDGDMFWLRAIASSFVAGGFTSIVFYSFAQIPGYATPDLIPAIVSTWFVRLAYEIVLLPITSNIVAMLKKLEGIDVIDTQTNLNPFRFSIVKPASIYKNVSDSNQGK